MKRFPKMSQLILLFSYVLLIAHTLAELPEEVKNEFIAHRRQLREARRLAGERPNLQSRRAILLDGVGETTNWAGAIQSPPPSGSFNSVSGQWTLPTVSRPPSANTTGTWYTYVWVGIDGYNCKSALLQSGTISSVQVFSSGDVQTGAQAWYEWVPNTVSLVSESDFPVAVGDTVTVSVQATSSTTATATLNNLSTGQEKTIDLSALSDSAMLCFTDVEWIVEDATNAMNNQLLPLADFGTVTIRDCAATTSTGATVDLSGAQLIDLVSNSNQVLATASVGSSTELKVSYG